MFAGLVIVRVRTCRSENPSDSTQVVSHMFHRACRANQVAAVGRPGGQIFVDNNSPAPQSILARPQASARHGVGDDKRPLNTATAQVVAQRRVRYVDAVGDESDMQAIGQTEHTLNHVIVPRQNLRASITQMGHKREASVDAGQKLVECGITMAGRYTYTMIHEHSRYSCAFIAFRRERDNASQTASRVEQSLHRIDVGPTGVRRRMRTDVARCVVEETDPQCGCPRSCRGSPAQRRASSRCWPTAHTSPPFQP